jgi:hypothetical protein
MRGETGEQGKKSENVLSRSCDAEALCRKNFSLWTAAAAYDFPHAYLVDVDVDVLVLVDEEVLR